MSSNVASDLFVSFLTLARSNTTATINATLSTMTNTLIQLITARSTHTLRSHFGRPSVDILLIWVPYGWCMLLRTLRECQRGQAHGVTSTCQYPHT